ncbi:MAG: right-handed parallel beta-helix repeat-containing protein, partial [Deltaproteobacteria bacterium]|nr:right-handed parallel beta-helix repeat-containing protein [Kofleriaceae bacterium]
IAAAAPGDALCLGAGRHAGPLVVKQPLTLWGAPGTILAAGPTESAIAIRADDVTIAGLTIEAPGFGILVEQSRRVRLVGNHVIGSRDPAVGQRGDTIKLWETDDAVIEGNLVEDGRDLVVWYSRTATVRDNQVLRARYGTHFMYSHGSKVEDNRYLDVTVGVFVMYTREVALTGNVIANAAGAAGIAIGLKDSGSVRIAQNLLVRDEVGIYLDATPQRRDEAVAIEGNQLRLCRTAIVFHASSGHGVEITGNDFGGNEAQVRVDGGGDAMNVAWRDNWFDDYAGYDLDGDGTGDVPYELRSFTGELVARRPELGFLRGTPALAMADAASHLDPLFHPKTLLVDPSPRMDAIAERGAR